MKTLGVFHCGEDWTTLRTDKGFHRILEYGLREPRILKEKEDKAPEETCYWKIRTQRQACGTDKAALKAREMGS